MSAGLDPTRYPIIPLSPCIRHLKQHDTLCVAAADYNAVIQPGHIFHAGRVGHSDRIADALGIADDFGHPVRDPHLRPPPPGMLPVQRQRRAAGPLLPRPGKSVPLWSSRRGCLADQGCKRPLFKELGWRAVLVLRTT